MKKILITSAILLCTITGFSQQAPAPKPPTAEQMAQREANALSQRLSLTEDQRSKAYAVYLDKAKKDLAAREARVKEMEKQREQATADAKQQSDKINSLLNADQKKTYQDMQTRLNGRPGGPGGPGGSPRMRPGPQQQGPGFRGPGGGQFQRPGNPGSRFQPGPGGQFQRPGNSGSRLQPGPGGQPQGRNMPPAFQRRLGGQGGQQGGPGGQNFRQKLRERLQSPEFQNRLNRFRQQRGPMPPTPDNSQPKPAETK